MNVTLMDVSQALGVKYGSLRYRADMGFYPWLIVTQVGENRKHYEIIPTKFREYYGDEIYNKVYNHA